MYFVLSSWYTMLFFYIIGMAPSSFMIYLYYHLYKLAAKGCKLRQRMKDHQMDQRNRQECGVLLPSCGQAGPSSSGSVRAKQGSLKAADLKTEPFKSASPKSGQSKSGQSKSGQPKIVPSKVVPKRAGKGGEKPGSSMDGSSEGPGTSMFGTRINNVSLLAAGKKLYLRPSIVQYQAAILVGVLIAVYFFFITPCYAVYAAWFYCPSCVEESWTWYLYPWTGLLNSGLNPILYFSLSKDFRKVLHPIRTKFVKAFNYLIELEYVTTT